METIELHTWDDFQSHVKSFQSESVETKNDSSIGHISAMLFRGQANAEWGLDTTLERWAGTNVSMYQYYMKISAIHPEIESRTGRTWKIPVNPKYRDLLEDTRQYRYPLCDDLYEYLVYLRHHGFPSPLLDWTRSPYIAAYFAYRTAKPDSNVAIFAFREYAGHGKVLRGFEPMIQELGQYVRSHERHFLQQSNYTVCFEKQDNTWQYSPHENGFSHEDRPQDQLWKIILPSSIRKEVLQYLQIHNITAASLFNAEDMIVESLAIREFVLNE
ncbi:MAG TPA: FRG domain-containing protein [Candidatus Hydrogenedentes bacterium]|nr:FRG domain-containing protein [Candidatus Hydrogenedentota bacterium]